MVAYYEHKISYILMSDKMRKISGNGLQLTLGNRHERDVTFGMEQWLSRDRANEVSVDNYIEQFRLIMNNISTD